VATLCERSGEGREGVYCWDFSGSRLEGYHETTQAFAGLGTGTVPIGDGWLSNPTPAFTSIVLGRDDLRALGENGPSDGDSYDDDDAGHVEYDDKGRAADDRPREQENSGNGDLNNNIIMQQVDSTAFRDLHQARVTGKIWIGWKLDSRTFALQQEARFMSRLDQSATRTTTIGDSKDTSTATSLQDWSAETEGASRLAQWKGKGKATWDD